MKAEEIIKIIDALIGKIHPVADSSEDAQRLANFNEITKILDEYISRIENVAEMRNSSFASMKELGELAHKYRNKLTSYDD